MITAQKICPKVPEGLPKIGLTDSEYCCALAQQVPLTGPWADFICLCTSSECSGWEDDLALRFKVKILSLVQNSSTDNKCKLLDNEYAKPKAGAKERSASKIYPFNRQHCAEIPAAT